MSTTEKIDYSRYPKGDLTEEEWQELVTLDYVLMWHYTDEYEKDLTRYKELSKKRWDSLISN